jgi:small subunit ribosomal protein S18
MAGIKPKRKRIIKINQVCPMCADKKVLNWREVGTISAFLTARGRIMARKQSGVCARHQKGLARCIKQARHLALLSFSGVVAEKE